MLVVKIQRGKYCFSGHACRRRWRRRARRSFGWGWLWPALRGQVNHCSIGRGCGWQWAVVKWRLDLDLGVTTGVAMSTSSKLPCLMTSQKQIHNLLGLDGVLYFVTRGLYIFTNYVQARSMNSKKSSHTWSLGSMVCFDLYPGKASTPFLSMKTVWRISRCLAADFSETPLLSTANCFLFLTITRHTPITIELEPMKIQGAISP